MDKIKKSFQTRKFKSASYSFGIIAVALAIVILLNLLVQALPASVTKIDLSFNQMYSLTETTKEFVKGLTEDITVYVVCQTGSEDADVMEMLQKYQALSSKIQVESVDPVLHPTFTSEYSEEAVPSGSLIVVSEKRFQIIPYQDLYEQTLNTSSYRYEVTGFDVEGQLTSALNYVTTDELPVIYQLEGHGVTALSSTLEELIEKNSMKLQSLNLLSAQGVPEDAACLIINAAANDLSSEEANQVITYLEQGGRAFFIDASDGKERPNLNSVMEHYGVRLLPGYAIETDTGHFLRPYANYLLPEVKYHAVTDGMEEEYLLLGNAGGISEAENTRTSVKVTPLLQTTENGFLRSMENSSLQSISMAEGDIAGPITVGAAVSENYQDIETRLLICSSPYLTNDNANMQVSGNNYKLVMNGLSWLCGLESNIAIDAKSFSMEYLQISADHTNRWTIITVVLLPVVCLAGGFVVWIRRRRR